MNRPRNRETAAEKKLRKLFDKKKQSYQQHQYINGMEVDYLLPGKIVVEVDGYVHLIPEKRKKDLRKNEKLSALGYKVIRFTNLEIFNDVRACFNKIIIN